MKGRYVTYALVFLLVYLYIHAGLRADNYLKIPEPLAINFGETERTESPLTSSKKIPVSLNPIERRIISIRGGTIHLNGAGIDIPEFALKKSTEISITAIGDLPGLAVDLVNVTAYHRGFRFLPHGTQFAKEVKIELPYDEGMIPSGYTIDDIQTYFFDESAREWKPLR